MRRHGRDATAAPDERRREKPADRVRESTEALCSASRRGERAAAADCSGCLEAAGLAARSGWRPTSTNRPRPTTANGRAPVSTPAYTATPSEVAQPSRRQLSRALGAVGGEAIADAVRSGTRGLVPA
jgi:hypothetical protein